MRLPEFVFSYCMRYVLWLFSASMVYGARAIEYGFWEWYATNEAVKESAQNENETVKKVDATE